ncbi:general substrate transporter [Dactylonectria estremocensis]|uniref:General substrate transporter n=1 Tax=Dactylonectria estremocensis TaxID=1079267 RepID=A0A9P9EHY1_9HYPO|nr:general substrate transporter [Dactylonectria estremocensis]
MAAPNDRKTSIEKTDPVEARLDDQIESSPAREQVAADAVTKGQAATGYETVSLWDTVRTFKIATACCFAAAFSAGADGYQMAMNASIIANKGFVQQFATEVSAEGVKFLAAGTISSWSATQNCGQIMGQTGISFLNARFGRKAGMGVLWLLIMCSVLTETFARNWKVWLVAKLLAGMGVGAMQATILGYISEIAPVRVRGSMLMLYSFWWTLGSFCTHVALQRLNRQDPYDWLTPIYTQWGHIGVMAIIYICLPESPAWCASVGKEEKAKKWLKLIHRDVKGYDVNYQYQVLALNIEHERAVAAEQRNEHWTAIFKGVDGRRTITAMWTIVAQQFLGLALFGTFGTYFFQQAGLEDPFKIKAITTSLQIVTVLSAVILVDKLGRRLMACGATTLMWISCLVVGILGVAPQSNATTYIFVMFVCFWNIGISANGAAGWGYIGEISSQRLRPYTSGFAASANSISGLIMSVLTPYMVNNHKWNWGYKTGFFYAGVGLIWVVGIWFIIPETAGRSAAELDELFERKIKAWQFKNTETATQRLVRVEKEKSGSQEV